MGIYIYILNSPSKPFQCASFSKAKSSLRQSKSLYPVLTKHLNCISSHSIIKTSLNHTLRDSESIWSNYPLIHPNLHSHLSSSTQDKTSWPLLKHIFGRVPYLCSEVDRFRELSPAAIKQILIVMVPAKCHPLEN